MDLRLQGKRALVTGSSIGIGEAIARALAAEGVAVAIHGRQPERTYTVAAEIEAQGGKTAVVLGDLKAPPDERGSNRHAQPETTAPHSYSTENAPTGVASGRSGFPVATRLFLVEPGIA